MAHPALAEENLECLTPWNSYGNTGQKIASAPTESLTASKRFLLLNPEKLHLAVKTPLSKITRTGVLPAEGYRAAGFRESPQA